jgi:hypothetical protein
MLNPVPTLDEIAAHPERASLVSPAMAGAPHGATGVTRHAGAVAH